MFMVARLSWTALQGPLTAFLVTPFVLNFVTGLGRVGNLLVHVRCVEREDKALGMAVQVLTAE